MKTRRAFKRPSTSKKTL